MNFEDLHGRQRQLPEVGDEGQARLADAELVVGASSAAFAELQYLHRAGVGKALLTGMVHPGAFAHAAHFRFRASRDLGAGAWRALRQIAAVVDWGSP